MTDLVHIRDVEFAHRETGSLAFDVHAPRDPQAPLALALYFHGGGWMRGSRADLVDARLAPAAGLGLAVASVSYRLSGEATWPAQLEDVREALRVVPGIVADHGVPLSGRVAAWGVSAGGHLALMLALTAEEDGAPAPDAVVAWFPPTDLSLMSRAPKDERARAPHFMPDLSAVPPFERRLLGLPDAAGPGDEERLRAASPIAHAHSATCPILLIHGDEDALVPLSHSLELDARLRDAGAPVSTLVLRGATHEDPAFDTPAVLGATAAHLRGDVPLGSAGHPAA